MTTLDELRAQAEIVQGHMAAIANLLSLAAIIQNVNQMKAIKVVMEYESRNMREESERLNTMMNEFKKEQGGMKRNVLITAVMVLVMFVLVAGFPAVAQDGDALATNTPLVAIQPVVATVNDVPVEATLVAPGDDTQPPVIVVENPPSDNTLYVIGLLVFLAFSGLQQVLSDRRLSGLVATVNKALDNKQVLDEAQRKYMEASLGTQEFVKLLTGVAGFAGAMIPGKDLAEQFHDFGEKVVSGEKPPGDVPDGVG